jgi:hypothetical protein
MAMNNSQPPEQHKLYSAVLIALDKLVDAVGLKAA